MKAICLLLVLFSVSLATSQYSLPSSLRITETKVTCDNVMSLITIANNELNTMKTVVNDIKNSRTLISTVNSLVSEACTLATQIKSLNFLQSNSRAKSTTNMQSSLRKLNNLKKQMTQNTLIDDMIGSRLDDIVSQLTEVAAQSDTQKIQQSCTNIKAAVTDLDNYLNWASNEISNRWINAYLPYRINALNQYGKGCVKQCTIEKTLAYGGPGGGSFETADPPACDYTLKKINIRAQNFVDSLQLVLEYNGYEYPLAKRGGTGGKAYTYVPNGKIKKIKVYYGDALYQYINGIQFITDKETSQLYGKSSGKSVEHIINGELAGMYGYDGDLMDKIGFKYIPKTGTTEIEQTQTEAVGGNGGHAFADPTRDGSYKLSKFNIKAGTYLFAIQAVLKQGSSEIQNAWHGENGGSSYIFTPSAPITKVKIMYEPTYVVTYIEFTTADGKVTGYGSSKTGTVVSTKTINIDGEIVGLHGRSGTKVDQLGFLVNRPKVYGQVKTEAEYIASKK